MGVRRRNPEVLAAVANGAIVVFLPSIVVALVTIVASRDPNVSSPVHPVGWSPWPDAIRFVLVSASGMAPFALVAGLRTWMLARRWRNGDRTWRGVVEAGACGLIVELIALLPGIVTRPTQAWAYIVAYGGLALIVGLVIGLILQASAVIVLTLARETTA